MCLYKVSVSQRYLPGVFNITDGFGPGIGAAFTVDPGLGGTCGLCAGFAGVGGLILSSGRFGRGGLGGVTGFLLPVVPGLISPVPDETPDAADDFLLLGGKRNYSEVWNYLNGMLVTCYGNRHCWNFVFQTGVPLWETPRVTLWHISAEL